MTWGDDARVVVAGPTFTVPEDVEDDPWFRHGGVRAPPRCDLPWAQQADRCPVPWAEVAA